MRIVLPLLALTLLCAAPAAAAAPDSVRVRSWAELTAPDKLEHGSLTLTTGLMIGVATRQPGAAIGGSLALGLGKELWDRRHTFFDGRDLLADALGAAAAAALTAALLR